MKKTYILFLFFFLYVANSFAQLTFQKVMRAGYESQANAVQQTTDSGYIIAGFVRAVVESNTDAYLIKTNAQGEILWTKTYSGLGDAEANAVQQTSDGGYIITGTTTDTADNTDLYLVKTNDLGDTAWTRAYTGITNNVGNSVQQTGDGGYIVTGWTDSYGVGLNDVYLIKTDVNGDAVWTKTYGGYGNEVGECVKQTTDSGYIIAGYTLGFGAGNADVYLIKTDADGDTLWTKTYGGTINDIAFSVQQTIDSGYIIAGWTNSYGAGGFDFYLIKTNSSGDTLWTKAYGGTEDDYAYDVHQTSDSGYIIAGTTASFADLTDDVYLIKINATGDTLWTKTYGGTGNDDGFSVAQTFDGGYILAGYTFSFVPQQDGESVYLIKANVDGNTSCNQGSPGTIVHATSTQTANSNAGILLGYEANTTATVVGSAGNDSTICFAVGIYEVSNDNSIFLYPNPADRELRIKNYRVISNSTVTVFNVLGEKMLYLPHTNGWDGSISIKDIASGIYFVQVKNEREQWVAKFVKE